MKANGTGSQHSLGKCKFELFPLISSVNPLSYGLISIIIFCRSTENVDFSNEQQKVELNYNWIIEEPIFLPQKSGESFYSPIFFAKDNRNIRWRLRICPEGANEESKDHLSLNIEIVFIGENISQVQLLGREEE